MFNFRSVVDHQQVVSVINQVQEDYAKEHGTDKTPRLNRIQHIEYLTNHLKGNLSSGYTSLDASIPWICYWICHSLSLLGHKMTDDEKSKIFRTLKECKVSTDTMEGFSGNPSVKMVHLASTYAAVATLCILSGGDLNSVEYLSILSTSKISRMLFSLKDWTSGAFMMHEDGEQDTRAVYCALIVADLCGVLHDVDEQGRCLTDGIVAYVASCQNYDGGLGPQPSVESHGGYVYCGLASLCLLQQAQFIDMQALVEWCCRRQLVDCAGGFQGRTNKLVDGCYSFWLGASMWMLAVEGGFMLNNNSSCLKAFESMHLTDEFSSNRLLFDQLALQEFILTCCQPEIAATDQLTPHKGVSSGICCDGGLRDKPGERPDLYHTCYCLSGLAVAQCDELLLGGERENQLSYVASSLPESSESLNPVYNLKQSFVRAAKTILSTQ